MRAFRVSVAVKGNQMASLLMYSSSYESKKRNILWEQDRKTSAPWDEARPVEVCRRSQSLLRRKKRGAGDEIRSRKHFLCGSHVWIASQGRTCTTLYKSNVLMHVMTVRIGFSMQTDDHYNPPTHDAKHTQALNDARKTFYYITGLTALQWRSLSTRVSAAQTHSVKSHTVDVNCHNKIVAQYNMAFLDNIIFMQLIAQNQRIRKKNLNVMLFNYSTVDVSSRHQQEAPYNCRVDWYNTN